MIHQSITINKFHHDLAHDVCSHATNGVIVRHLGVEYLFENVLRHHLAFSVLLKEAWHDVDVLLLFEGGHTNIEFEREELLKYREQQVIHSVSIERFLTCEQLINYASFVFERY